LENFALTQNSPHRLGDGVNVGIRGNNMKRFAEEAFSFNEHGNPYGSVAPEFIAARDGIELAYSHMKSKSEQKGIMVFVHGAGAHCLLADIMQYE